MWLHSVWLEIGRKEKNLQLTCITRSAKCICTSLSSMLSFRSLEHVWLKIIWLKSSHNLEWLVQKACRKPTGQNLLDGMTEWKCGLAAEYCWKFFLTISKQQTTRGQMNLYLHAVQKLCCSDHSVLINKLIAKKVNIIWQIDNRVTAKSKTPYQNILRTPWF